MLSLLLKDMLKPLSYMGYAMIISLCVTTIVMIFKLRKTSKWDWCFFLSWLVFIVYVIVLVQMALLSREPGNDIRTDLIPFSTWGPSVRSKTYLIENIIMFIPMGVLLPILFELLRKIRKVTIVLLLISVTIELMQLITKRGYMQTDDVIMNIVGGIIGFTISSMILRRFYI